MGVRGIRGRRGTVDRDGRGWVPMGVRIGSEKLAGGAASSGNFAATCR